MQLLSANLDTFIVVCMTPTSFGYQVVSSSVELFTIHSLVLPDSDITDLIFGSYKPFLLPESDAFVYIRNGELTFGTLFDGRASLPIFLDVDTNCGPNAIVNIYPLPKAIQGKFRFILDCLQQKTDLLLRYKVTLSLEDPSFPDSVHILPTALATGTPISSPDSEYFVIVQDTSIAAVRTEQTGTYRVHSFQYALHDVSFTDSVVPILAIVSPGHDHVLLYLDRFISDYNTSVIELADTPAFCPNQSLCLPHNMAASADSDLFFTFTANYTAEDQGSTRYFHLIVHNITLPSKPLLKIHNLALQPKIALPRDISWIFPSTSSSTSMHLYQSTLVPSPTYSLSSSIPGSLLAYSQSTAVHFSSTVVDGTSLSEHTASKSHGSSSTAVIPTPNDNSDKDNKLLPINFTSTVAIFCALVVVLLLVIVLSLLIITLRRQARRPKDNTFHAASYEEKFSQMLSPSPTGDPSAAVNTDDSVPVNAVSVAETNPSPVSRSSSGQLVTTALTLDLKGSSRTLDSGKSSGASSAAGSPSTCSGELATNKY